VMTKTPINGAQASNACCRHNNSDRGEDLP
jgi:hypothetical protein